MSTRKTLITAGDMSANKAGDPFELTSNAVAMTYSSWGATGAPNGSLKWQYSHDCLNAAGKKEGGGNATWTDVEGGVFAATIAGSAGSSAEPFRYGLGWFRPYYVADSGGSGNTSLFVQVEIG